MSTNGNRYDPVPGRIPGTAINLGGVDFVMPPLNLDQVRDFEEKIGSLGAKQSIKENIEDALPVLHAALSRNYTDLTIDQLRPLIDLGNFKTACDALVKSSGYVPAKPGEAVPASR